MKEKKINIKEFIFSNQFLYNKRAYNFGIDQNHQEFSFGRCT